jgi:hypothetical protein
VAKYATIIGDGSTTVFDLDVGFLSSSAVVRLFDDTHGGEEVKAFTLFRQVPTPTSIRLALAPAPPLAALFVKVSDGTEPP